MPLEDGSIKEVKDLNYFKDQVARENRTPEYNEQYHNFQHILDFVIQGYESAIKLIAVSDRAATLFAEHERKEGLDEGYEKGFDDGHADAIDSQSKEIL